MIARGARALHNRGVRSSRVAFVSVLGVVAACGARTPLLAPPDASEADALTDAIEEPDAPVDACATHCSADLHEVLDCHGDVVEVCAANEGCDGTGCSEACLAAQSNQSTVGCEYYAIDPDSISYGVGGCFAVFVANTWTTPVALHVDRAGQTFDASQIARVPSGSGQSLQYNALSNGALQPGEVAILFLAAVSGASVACPSGIVPALDQTDPAVHGTGLGNAFHVTASAPVVAYQIFPYGGGQSAITAASLLLPTAPFATNFVAAVAYEQSQLAGAGSPSLAIVATQDQTAVTINPSVAIGGGPGVASAVAGTPTTYTLSAGEELQFTQTDSLSGSIIQSSRPIAVWGGNTCMNIEPSDPYCDVGSQQLPAVQALGSEYVGVRYRNRYDDSPEEVVPWRFVGAVDQTQLTFDPPVSGAPSTISKGELAELWATGPFVVRSQDAAHPFYLSAHMTSSHYVPQGVTDERGDPEFVNVIPTAQFISSYTFFTDPTYPETNLVVVREPNAGATYDDVTLDCAGALTGWQPIGASAYQFTRIDLVRGNFVPQNGCDNGRHVMTSPTPFSLTVWGWGSEATTVFTKNVSYAYPAGARIMPINDVVVAP